MSRIPGEDSELRTATCEMVLDSADRFVEIGDAHAMASGGFAVVEGSPPTVVLLDDEGVRRRSTPQGRLGRTGLRIRQDGDGRLVVPDPSHDRVAIYDPETLDLVGTVSLGLDRGLAFGWHTDGHGRLYFLVPDSLLRGLLGEVLKPTAGIRVVTEGVVQDRLTVEMPPGSGAVYGPKLGWCVLRDGTVVICDGANPRLDYYPAGTLARSAPAPGPGAPISEADRELIVAVIEAEAVRIADDLSPLAAALIRSEARPENIAEVYPAFTQVLSDDHDRIWFRMPAAAAELREHGPRTAFHMVDNGSSRWLVQEPEGTPRWTASFPAGFTLTQVRGGMAVGHMRAADHARLQVYRVTPPRFTRPG